MGDSRTLKAAAAALAATVMLTGCASVMRTASYAGAETASVTVQGKQMLISVHPHEPTLMGQVASGTALGSSLLETATLGAAKGFQADVREVDAALRLFVAPTGCTVEPARMVGNDNVRFEAVYSCPAGVDLRAITTTQKASLMRGAPIRMP